ncbi:MAG: phycobiliprotein lyase [Aulosira sp. DedQUE10]|nr:phycobiliprotein lyase [Aulosira sp. DedQUE10]
MTLPLKVAKTAQEDLIAEFFWESVGKWRSERRYYTLSSGTTKEIVSAIAIRFLKQGCEELQQLSQLHELPDSVSLVCGTEVIWESTDLITGKRESQGSTLFGALGNILYRDRGFATPKPITAEYYFPNPKTLCLRTEYNSSVFEEELKLIGSKYRTRQTIISRAGEQLMIGQYLETRVESINISL